MERAQGGDVNPLVHGTTAQELLELKALGVGEVIIGLRDFSRMGKLSQGEGIKLAREARKLGMRALFQWDLLMTEDIFVRKARQIAPLLVNGDFDALRVQDGGALQWALEETHLPLHWIVEAGNHNQKALEGWSRLMGERLQRLVLSTQIPKDQLKVYGAKLHCPLEILGLGPILLFYTPRSLLEAFGESSQDDLSVLATSDESAHKDFPVLSNVHGTFLFHQKHHWLLECIGELEERGITHLRLEVDSLDWCKRALGLLQQRDDGAMEAFRADYPHPLIRGFFSRNKSSVLFPKLKNEKLEKWRKRAIGEVIGVDKDGLMAVELRGGSVMKEGEEYRIHTPEGKEIPFVLSALRELSSDFVVMNAAKSVCPKSLIVKRS